MASEPERQEFESFCVQYPEIADARKAFELQLEEQLMKDAAVPPAFLKQQVEDRLGNAASDANDDQQLEESKPVRGIGIWKWVAAASIILMAGAIYWAI